LCKCWFIGFKYLIWFNVLHAAPVLYDLYITFQNGPFRPLFPTRPGLQIDITNVPSLIDRNRDANNEYIEHEAH
jgi:hypothetical protein